MQVTGLCVSATDAKTTVSISRHSGDSLTNAVSRSQPNERFMLSHVHVGKHSAASQCSTQRKEFTTALSGDYVLIFQFYIQKTRRKQCLSHVSPGCSFCVRERNITQMLIATTQSFLKTMLLSTDRLADISEQ